MIMSATNFKTVNQTYRQLISNGTYSIPRFQRDYSWTDEEWVIFGKIYSMLLEMMKTK